MKKRIELVLLALLLFLPDRGAVLSGNPVPDQTVAPEALNEAIQEVLSKRQFRWRIPRDPVVEEREVGALERFLENVLETTMRAWNAVQRWYTRLRNWLRSQRPFDPGGPQDHAMGEELPWVIVTTVLAVALLVWMLLRWRRKKNPARVRAGAVPGPLPEIDREDITADLLPEEGWLKMALDLLEKGEARLALRALFMAILADLSHRGKITVSRFKSNHEYITELNRRTHYVPDLGSAFSENVQFLERVWYGNHPATQEVIEGFQENRKRIKQIEV